VLIDWFTVGAQAVNFLILVALLKRFLYGPILRAMERREKRIAERVAEAKERVNEARRAEERYGALLQELEAARGVRLRAVEDEAAERRKALLAAAKEEAGALRAAWGAAIQQEREDFFIELKKRVGFEMLRIARQVLGDLADAELVELLAARFGEKLAQLDEGDRRRIGEVVRTEGLTVRSPHALPEALCGHLAKALQQVLGPPAEIHFVDDAAMPLGLEMGVGGLKLSWGVDSYFEQLRQALAVLLDGQGGVESTQTQAPPARSGGFQ
jgi:F-type H+-transporting ATPase subunit b